MKTGRLILFFTAIWLIFSLQGCNKEYNSEAVFPEEPINFTILNTSDNDYNSNIGPGRRLQITFSSDRYSNDYNFVVKRVDMEYSSSNDELNMTLVNNDSQTVMESIAQKVNSSANEFGPHSLSDGQNLYLLYANDESGYLDIRYVICEDVAYEQEYAEEQIITEPLALSKLNSAHNDAYPCVEDNRIYFCTDRKGDYDICYTDITNPFSEWLTSSDTIQLVYADVINSIYDDKCPFVIGDLLVFTSNREGGFGGYDLYYCTKNNDGSWSKPANFGSTINSEYDEFRPVVDEFIDFNNDMMIFSSNRPGGLGGFDLYYVGISKMINIASRI